MIVVSSLIVFSSFVADQAFAQAWILQECGLKYQEHKAAGELARKNWQDFLKDCSTQLRIYPKHIILEDIKKSAPEHHQSPENKDVKATDSVEPMPDYMSRDNWTPERWAKARERRQNTKTPSSNATDLIPRGTRVPTTPTYAIPPDDYQRGSIGVGGFAL